MEMSREILVAGVLFFVALVFLYHRSTIAKKLPLPPGPKPRFFSGNGHQLPSLKPWLTYASWSKVYGPLVYFRTFNTRFLVLNSSKTALDLLETRSAIYSDRPRAWMLGVLAGRESAVFTVSFSHPRFKIYRKLLHSGLNVRAVREYSAIQMQETKTLLKGLVQTPENFVAHIKRNAGAVILKVAYGYQVESHDDKFVRTIENAVKFFGAVGVPGRFWVESFPTLRFVPDWFPGAGFKRFAKQIGREVGVIERVPFNWAKEQITSGNYLESFISKNLQREVQGPEMEDILRWCSSALYTGGADTTVSALTAFFLLMTLYPDIQKKAQNEIDRTIGERLPTPEDFSSMPYLSAMLKEILRWGPVAPLGIRHRVIKDDIYDGYFIPKGTIVIPNIWAITHDPEIYPDPEVFDPNRHLGEQPQIDPLKFVFGFGRRGCPGSHFAEVSLFLNISSILATFDIKKALDPEGNEIEPVVEWSSGVTSHLKPFECRIIPRSKDIHEILDLKTE
ncbi:cytochrome P450 [Collybia nuda]|uniref:Cytochrome P450 n=1 Tax=Collybia nuda TaxID=64659 RepID=A0A9P5Y4A6_9AGAR|nr:cytochrome P450 [Collybia nuda]